MDLATSQARATDSQDHAVLVAVLPRPEATGCGRRPGRADRGDEGGGEAVEGHAPGQLAMRAGDVAGRGGWRVSLEQGPPSELHEGQSHEILVGRHSELVAEGFGDRRD